MPNKDPYSIPTRNPLWNVVRPSAVGVLFGGILAYYPNFMNKDWKLQVPLVNKIPGYCTVPDKVYLALLGFLFGIVFGKGCNWTRLRILKKLYSYTGWLVDGKSFKTKAWAMCIKLLRGPAPYSTFAFQQFLPKQPLPELHDTLNRWDEVSRQLVNKDDYELTKEAIDEFKRNEGPVLQKYLTEKAHKEDNYIYHYWLAGVYLSGRSSLAINSNYYVTNTVITERTTDPLARAAEGIYTIMTFEKMLSEDVFPPSLIQDLVPLCMAGTRYLFNAIRIPGEYIDELERYPGKRHIVVTRKGFYFKTYFEHIDQNGRRQVLTPQEIKQQLQNIIKMADALPREEAPVAALTGQKRNIWAKQRLQLIEKNQETMQDLESCMFIVNLDDKVPKDYSEQASLSLTGHGNDRWFDKCFTFGVFGDSSICFNVEHSVIDAMVLVLLAEYMNIRETYENGDVHKVPCKSNRNLPEIKRLTWDLSEMESLIQDASKELMAMINDIELYSYYSKYGKGFMKKQRISPDGFIQMAIQLAYYRMHGAVVKTYEPSTGRMFLLGRTETVNPVSAMSLAWMKSMDNDIHPWQTKKELLKRAITYQNDYRLEATVGKGCDRHLFSLMCASRELGMDLPKIFTDKAWLLPYKLSTSQTPNKLRENNVQLNYKACGGGFGPACHDGYGICYAVFGDEHLTFHITTWKSCEETSSIKFAAELEKAMEDMKSIFKM